MLPPLAISQKESVSPKQNSAVIVSVCSQYGVLWGKGITLRNFEQTLNKQQVVIFQTKILQSSQRFQSMLGRAQLSSAEIWTKQNQDYMQTKTELAGFVWGKWNRKKDIDNWIKKSIIIY